MRSLFRFAALRPCLHAFLASTVLLLSSCGSSGTSTTTTTTSSGSGSSGSSSSSVDYASAYKAATWAPGVTVAFPSNCSMTVSASGVPPSHQAYYLAPVGTGQTAVATTPSGIQLAVIAYASSGISTVKTISATFNICPVKASATTATSLGAIGLINSGEAIFNAYEATKTVALGDNVSYTFSVNGTSYTASFIDGCNSHANGGSGSGTTWRYHGNPVCWTPTVDGTGASHIIGIALDGFPIYGGRDNNGAVVDASTLDSCNGITSATPEFPSGAYHYVLPVDSKGNAITTAQSSLGCYSGTVSATLSAQMKQLACKMPMLLASGEYRLPDGREVSRSDARAFMARTMPEMMLPEGTEMKRPRMDAMANMKMGGHGM